jgi:predicted Na+-dependent transporter
MRLEVGRRARAQAPFLTVLLLVAASFAYLASEPGHWRRGTVALAGAMMLGGVLRLSLPAARAGLLAVRGRWWDGLCYLALGGLILMMDIRLRH